MMTAENFTRERLGSDLKRMGIGDGDGDVVLFHSSLKRIGRVEPGPESVIEAFLEVLGPEGTLVAPALVPAGQGLRPLFDIAATPSEVGLLAEVARKWQGAIRSDQSTHSVSAIGVMADAITDAHLERGWGPETPWGENAIGFDSPWDRLREMNAWILLIGVGFDRCTMLHHAQARYRAAHEGVTAETPWPSFDFAVMGEHLEKSGIVKHGKLGNAECLLVRAGDMIDTALALLENCPDVFFKEEKVMKWKKQYDHVNEHGHAKAAAFAVDVTPPNPDREVGRPLRLRGIILDHPQDGRGALLLWDHCVFYEKEGAVIRGAVAEAADIPIERVLLTATHTHSGHGEPFIADPEYLAFVAEKAREGAKEAVKHFEPVRIAWTSIDAPGITRNRNAYLKTGGAYTERWAIPSTWHVSEEDILKHGPIDEESRILLFDRLDGSRLAIFSVFSCHNSAALLDPRINDDFFGVAMEIIEAAEGEGCVALIAPGTQGDHDPTGMVELGGVRNMKYAARLGRRLSGYILSAIQDLETRDVFSLSFGTVPFEVEVRKEWGELKQIKGHPELVERAMRGVAKGEITAMVIGGFAIIAVPAEVFTETGREIRRKSPFEITSVVSLTNGEFFYIPDAEAFVDTSWIYGVESHPAAMAAPGSDARIIEASLNALEIRTTWR